MTKGSMTKRPFVIRASFLVVSFSTFVIPSSFEFRVVRYEYGMKDR